jgi:hypothetical protein
VARRRDLHQTNSIKKERLPPTITIRNYWPKEEALNGTYKNPPIKKVE